VLEEIVAEPAQQDLLVPPGVYAELRCLYLKQNKKNEAIRFFGLKEKAYPESRILMQRLIQADRA